MVQYQYLLMKDIKLIFELLSSSGTLSTFYIDMYADTNILCHADYVLYAHILFFY